MVTDVALKGLKPKKNPYKVTDRDGMYLLVTPSGVSGHDRDSLKPAMPSGYARRANLIHIGLHSARISADSSPDHLHRRSMARPK